MKLKKLLRLPANLQRKRNLRNHGFTIISNTCIGGVITHCVGEQFRSPTVNLVIYEADFLMFCQHLKEYSTCLLELPSEEEASRFQNISYPVGMLRGSACSLPDIPVFFVHYKTFEDAKKKWDERFRRINYNNLFFLMDRGMDAKDEILDGFHSLPGTDNKVFFTHRKDPVRWPCTFQLSYYTPEKYVEALMYRGKRKGLSEYLVLDEFDFVQWLNDGTICRNPIFD